CSLLPARVSSDSMTSICSRLLPAVRVEVARSSVQPDVTSTSTAGRGCCSRLRARRRAAPLPGARQPPTRRETSANTRQAREIERRDHRRMPEFVARGTSADLEHLVRTRAVANPPPFLLWGVPNHPRYRG